MKKTYLKPAYIAPAMRTRDVRYEDNFLMTTPGGDTTDLQDGGWDGDSLWS